MRGRPPRLHDRPGNSIMIEMGYFFTKMEVLHQCRAASASLQGILIVGNLDALIPGHDLTGLDGVTRQIGGLFGLTVNGLFAPCRGGLASSAGCGRSPAPLARLGHTELPE